MGVLVKIRSTISATRIPEINGITHGGFGQSMQGKNSDLPSVLSSHEARHVVST